MRVVICGPNLRDQSKCSFHVHAEGCADLKRTAKRDPAYEDELLNGAVYDVQNAVEVVDLVYPPEDFECESGEYLYDFHFFPCCDNLPTGNRDD